MKNGEILIQKVQSLVANGHELTKLELDGAGITLHNINWLIDNNYIKRVSRGLYKPVMVESEKSNKEKVAYNMVLDALKKENFEDAKNYLYALYEIPDYKEDVLLLIYLINLISYVDDDFITLTEELKKKVINYGEMERRSDRKNLYKTCIYCLFSPAVRILDNLEVTEKVKYKEALTLLLEKNKDKRLAINTQIKELLKQDRITDLYDYLNNEKEEHSLSEKHSILLYLAEVYKNALETSSFPDIINHDVKTSYRYGLIYNNDFEGALKSLVEYKSTIEDKLNKSMLYVLLESVVRLKKQISGEFNSTTRQENHSESEILELVLMNSTSYNFEEIARNYNLTDDDVLIYKLLFARESYKNNLKIIGDKMLRDVEKYPNKSSRVKQLLAEIKNKKYFYLNVKKYSLN